MMLDIVRQLMWQVAEEQQLRKDLILNRPSHTAVKPPNDAEVKTRIEEVERIIRGEKQ